LTDKAGHGGPEHSLLLKRATKLNDILATHNIAASVHTLTLHGIFDNWIDAKINTLIPAILPRLPNIQTFTWNAGGAPHKGISIDFAAAIQVLCRSPNLTKLYLKHVTYFPFTTITACPNLRCLGLSYCGLEFNNVNSMSSSQLLHLESLEVDWVGIEFLASHVSGDDVPIAKYFTSMKNLQLELNDLSYDGILSRAWKIMLLASQTLTKLELFVDQSMFRPENESFDVLIDLGRFPALRHFKSQLRIEHHSLYLFPCFLTWLLFISSSSSGIEVLEIEFFLVPCQEWTGR